MNTLLPISLLKILEIIPNDWMVAREFLKNDKRIWVKGFGRTKQEALQDYDAEKLIEESYSDKTNFWMDE